MITISNSEVVGWEAAIRGMRNPMNSWENSDSYDLGVDPISNRIEHVKSTFQIGKKDHELMMKLVKAGSSHAKFRRMIVVYLDIVAPLYWWKQFDTYHVGTVTNSCSTMHKIAEKEFTLDDFSQEYLADDFSLEHLPYGGSNDSDLSDWIPLFALRHIIRVLNVQRNKFLETNDKKYWWQMIQLLPSSYNQKRTIMLNYEVLAKIYFERKNHKLDEWVALCKWVEDLPHAEIIIGENI